MTSTESSTATTGDRSTENDAPAHRSVEWAIDILSMCAPIRCHQGGMWFGRNHNFADATFIDYGAADAFAIAAGSLATHVKRIARLEAAMKAVCDELEEDFDVIDGGDGQPAPNKAMRLASELKEAIYGPGGF